MLCFHDALAARSIRPAPAVVASDPVRQIRAILASLATCGSLALSTAVAQGPVTAGYELGRLPVAIDAVDSPGADLFGEKVNLYNGSLSFEQADVSLPGNHELPVALVRIWAPRPWWGARGAMGDWDIHTPRIEGTFSEQRGFVPAFGSAANRCSGFNSPPAVAAGMPAADFDGWEYWQGTHLAVPGRGSQEILRRHPQFVLAPADGQAYPLITRDLWQIGCLPTLRNGTGQGFMAVAPDGTRYVFDWLAVRNQTSMRKGDAVLGRREWQIFATNVTDRFGNWVNYSYDPGQPGLLTRIESSDGRVISLAYSSGRVSTVNDGTRTWQYLYWPDGDLKNVTLPDASAWTFNLRPMVFTQHILNEDYTDCDSAPSPPSGQFTGSMQHPSGASGTFVTEFMVQGRSNVVRACTYAPGSNWTNGAMYPKATYNQALIEKRIEGPGLTPLRWQYFVSNGYTGDWAPCTNCPDRKINSVIDPDGRETRYHFGIHWRANEGQLLRTEEGWSNGSALRVTEFRYRASEGQAYPNQFGVSVNFQSDLVSSRNLPQDKRSIWQQGVEFRWEAYGGEQGLDILGRPRSVVRSSGLGYTRSETTTYHDNLSAWVIGAVASVVADGRTVEATEFDGRDQPKSKSAFGRLLESYKYHPDGNLREVTDAAGQPTQLANFWRGQPQVATFADGAQETQVVNNLGHATSRTNAAGTTHRLAHDAMGRLGRVDYPTGDPVEYHPTLLGFEQVWHNEFGLGPGHWRQTVQTGQAVTTRYFDALLRERLRWQRDASRPQETSSFVETRYDHAGRKTFHSYPERNFGVVNDSRPGVRTEHDALGRPVLEVQDSELGPLTRQHHYTAPFQRQQRNERGFWTTYSFQAYDEPKEDLIRAIWMPHEVYVGIERDNFGKALAITRAGGNGSGPGATRRYVYDQHQRLCKIIEPESGAAVQDYDAAGNLAWRATGLALSDPFQCNREQVPALRRISHGYDSRNRLISTQYGDGSPGIARNYTADGLPSAVASTEMTWTYRYNNRRSLVSEWLSWPTQAPGTGWNFTWSRNANGHVAGLTDPWGGIDYQPDALGRPTRAGSYASEATYHPNGALASLRFGSGSQHVMQQNLRGLPTLWRDSDVLQFRHHYDAAGNVTSIADEFEGLAGVSMQYDGLDRLTVADGRWGFGHFQYDALDNITHSTVGGRSLTHHIDPGTQRLVAMTGSQQIAIAYDANGNVSERAGQAYHFDLGNRLRQVPGLASYQYDGHGRRHWLARTDGSGRLSAYSLTGQLLFTWDSNHGHTRYVSLGKRLVAEQGEGGVVTYVHTDALGSPVARTRPDVRDKNRLRYEPYGAVFEGKPRPGVGYTGHVNDPDTGLIYMQQRYYEPLAGRFLSVDPVLTDATDGSYFNRYEYAESSPYRFIDPDGRTADCTGTRIPSGCPSIGGISLASSGGSEFASASSPETNQQGLSNTKGDQAFVEGAKIGIEAAAAVIAPVRVLRYGLAIKSLSEAGRAGKQARLRDLVNDHKLGSADRGWIRQEINSIQRGQRSTIRNPPGRDLAHERGREAAKGYDYSHSRLQERDLHRLQHKYDDFGRANTERPIP